MQELNIQKVTIQDLPILQTIAKETFIAAFGSDNSQKNMDIYVANSFNAAKILAEFQHPDSEFYLAKTGSETIAYLKLNTGSAQTEELKEKDQAMEIERIYVDSQYQGKQVGQALMDKAISLAKAKQKDFLWLGVWEHNPKAIQFYKKNGFVAFDSHIFMMVDDPQRDILMKKRLY